MDLRQVIDSLDELARVSQIKLAREASLSRFRLYQFMNGDVKLSDAEERALLSVLSQRADRAEKAIAVIRQAAQA
jgi:hypothetical protein